MVRKLTKEEEIVSYTNRRNRMREYYHGRPRPDRPPEYYREKARKEGNLPRKQRNRKLYQLIKDGIVNKPKICPSCKMGENKILATYPTDEYKNIDPWHDWKSVVWICCQCLGLQKRKGPNENFNKHSRCKKK